MSRKKKIDSAVIEGISEDLFTAMLFLRKRVHRMDIARGDVGLPLSHLQTMVMLNETGAMSVSEISERLGIAKPNITPLVDRLIEGGYVDRVRDTTDRRVVNVVILDAGRDVLGDIQKNMGEQIQGWSQSISSQDFRDLCDALQTLVRVLPAIP